MGITNHNTSIRFPSHQPTGTGLHRRNAMLAQVQAKIKRLKEQKAPSKSGSESWAVIQMGETSKLP
jgi:hypothetical protein